MKFPSPHYEKLKALLDNDKLPPGDKPRIMSAIDKYEIWRRNSINLLKNEKNAGVLLDKLVYQLNEYKDFIDIEIIFDSKYDFLYRQKGQIKLDNTVIEEFLPFLINDVLIPEINGLELEVGPTQSFASAYFTSSLKVITKGGGLTIHTKNQDFAISKKLYLKASHSSGFPPSDSVTEKIYVAYVAAECKTNLDKTMFQEACATAHDVKSAVQGAKYYLLIEWLDMPPVTTAPTDIDEVILLRKAKRLNSNIRKYYSSYKGRMENREGYVEHIKSKPLLAASFQRFIKHIKTLLIDKTPIEETVLDIGYF